MDKRAEVAILIDNNIIGRHAERDRELLKLRIIDGLTFDQLADEFSTHEQPLTSTNGVKRVYYNRILQIKSQLEAILNQ